MQSSQYLACSRRRRQRHSRSRRRRSRPADCPGTYETKIKSPAQLKGTWAITLAKGGAYTVAVNGQPGARGNYSTTPTTITFVRERGSGCTGRGTYTWKRSGKIVTFVRKRESSSCQARAAVLAHRFTQVR